MSRSVFPEKNYSTGMMASPLKCDSVVVVNGALNVNWKFGA